MKSVKSLLHFLLFFTLGAALTVIILASFSYLFFSFTFQNKVYPGVRVSHIDVSAKTKAEIKDLFSEKSFSPIKLTFSSPQATVSASASDINLKFDPELMANRAYSIGRQTKNPYYNFLQILAASQGQINLPLEVTLDRRSLDQVLSKIARLVDTPPVDAVFKFTPWIGPDQRGRVVAFSPSATGLALDTDLLASQILDRARLISPGENLQGQFWLFTVTTKVLYPAVTTTTADSLGIKSLLGEGTSYFYDSIPGRVYNIGLGSQKVSGRLIAPKEIFSFDEAIGTVSAVFGFQKAYSIIKNKTVLDDGGGVCQVSTTLYRAVLNAGLPVIARTAHTYRVGFYEQGGFLPGLDATVYPPDPDLKFKNDTGNWILIQASFDPASQKLTFDLFGSPDGRSTQILGPYILSTSPPPDPIYEDDPTLPVGQTKQVDTAHWGAKVYFKRTVTKNGETLINETVSSDYIPWPARFLKGTRTQT